MGRLSNNKRELMIEMIKAGCTNGEIERLFDVVGITVDRYRGDIEKEGGQIDRNIELIKELLTKGIESKGFIKMDSAKLLLEIIDKLDENGKKRTEYPESIVPSKRNGKRMSTIVDRRNKFKARLADIEIQESGKRELKEILSESYAKHKMDGYDER